MRAPRPLGLPRRIPQWAWKALKAPRSVPRAKPAWFWVWRAWRLMLGVKKAPFTMYDNVNLSLLPFDAPAYAGYVDGKWANYNALVKKFPKAKHLSIAAFASEDAMALDVEFGDATVAQAAGWVRRQQARGVKQPILYTSLSWAPSLMRHLAQQGITRNEYKLWTAHYTGKPHICSSACGLGFTGNADATQYTDRALGRSLDASLCLPNFF